MLYRNQKSLEVVLSKNLIRENVCSLCIARFPFFALFNSCSPRGITVFRITRILSKQFARNIRTFSAMNEPFTLTTHCHRTFAVKRVSVCFYTTTASAGFFVVTTNTMKSATSINYLVSPFFLD